MSAATDDDVVLTVLVFPKSTGAFVTTVKSPLNVIPSRQICVVEAVVHVEFDIGCGLTCHTANVPVERRLVRGDVRVEVRDRCARLVRSARAAGRIALEVERVGRGRRVVVRIEDERRERHGSGRGGGHARRARGRSGHSGDLAAGLRRAAHREVPHRDRVAARRGSCTSSSRAHLRSRHPGSPTVRGARRSRSSRRSRRARTSPSSRSWRSTVKIWPSFATDTPPAEEMTLPQIVAF